MKSTSLGLLFAIAALSAGWTAGSRAGEGETAVSPARPSLRLSPEQAKAIALKETAGGRVTKYERLLRDNAWFHDIEIAKAGSLYALLIADADDVALRYTEIAAPDGQPRTGSAPAPATPAPAIPATTAPGVTRLSFADAQRIALADYPGGLVVGYELDREHGLWRHEIEVADGQSLHEMMIDDRDGTISRRRQNRGGGELRWLRQRVAPKLTPDQAADLAFAVDRDLALATNAGAVVTEYELDAERGALVHEFNIRAGAVRVEVDINDADGGVRKLHRRHRP